MSLSSIQFGARIYFPSRIALRIESVSVRIFRTHSYTFSLIEILPTLFGRTGKVPEALLDSFVILFF